MGITGAKKSLDKEDFWRMMDDLDANEMSRKECDRIFDSADMDNNGEMDIHEFLEAVPRFRIKSKSDPLPTRHNLGFYSV